mgnify:CR=1 FL=1
MDHAMMDQVIMGIRRQYIRRILFTESLVVTNVNIAYLFYTEADEVEIKCKVHFSSQWFYPSNAEIS